MFIRLQCANCAEDLSGYFYYVDEPVYNVRPCLTCMERERDAGMNDARKDSDTKERT